jgi:type VI secretion system secreted protein Hcp
MSRFVFVVLAGFAMLGTTAPASAQEIFCTVVGAKQGTFQADRSGKTASQIPVLFLTEEITVPIDAATGLPTGRRMHKPLIIIKELDASSIQFFTAVVNSELLRSVTCTFYRSFRREEGGMRAYFKIALTNARIVAYKDAGDGINGTAPGDQRESISLTYQRIELTDLDSNGTAVADWEAALG